MAIPRKQKDLNKSNPAAAAAKLGDVNAELIAQGQSCTANQVLRLSIIN